MWTQIRLLLKDYYIETTVILDFLLSVKAVTLIFISGLGWAVSSAKQGKSGSMYNLVKH